MGFILSYNYPRHGRTLFCMVVPGVVGQLRERQRRARAAISIFQVLILLYARMKIAAVGNVWDYLVAP